MRVALVQLTSTDNLSENLDSARRGVRAPRKARASDLKSRTDAEHVHEGGFRVALAAQVYLAMDCP